MSDIRMIIMKPLITEKNTVLRDTSSRYVFKVDIRANKSQIKQAVEKLFNVHVKNVTTAVYRGKPSVTLNRSGRFEGKKSNWKKAFVTIAEGETIEIFDVV